MLVDRTAFLTAEIARKHETLKFIQGYDSARATTGIHLVRLYIEQCSTELCWIESIQVEQ
jgi:hypothetical protein